MKKIIYFVASLSILLSCKKDPVIQPEQPGAFENGLIILNEGLFQQNNASLTYYSTSDNQSYQQVFFNTNQRGLGDTANDFEKYSLNGKDYIIIVVDVSSQIEIIEANTLISVAQIPLFNGSVAREPRKVIVSGSKAYVCNYDGTVSIIDLATYTVLKTLIVGANPDGLAIVGNNLYVSNSGGLDFPIYDSTLSIIDINAEQVIGSITTRINSTKMLVDNQGDIYLFSAGNYSSVGPALLRVDTQSNQIIDTFNLDLTEMAIYNDWIYIYNSMDKNIKRLNTLNETFETSVFIDCSAYETFYKMSIDQETGDIYCVDAKAYVNSSVVSCYNSNGDFKYQFTAGLNANKIIVN